MAASASSRVEYVTKQQPEEHSAVSFYSRGALLLCRIIFVGLDNRFCTRRTTISTRGGSLANSTMHVSLAPTSRPQHPGFFRLSLSLSLRVDLFTLPREASVPAGVEALPNPSAHLSSRLFLSRPSLSLFTERTCTASRELAALDTEFSGAHSEAAAGFSTEFRFFPLVSAKCSPEKHFVVRYTPHLDAGQTPCRAAH